MGACTTSMVDDLYEFGFQHLLGAIPKNTHFASFFLIFLPFNIFRVKKMKTAFWDQRLTWAAPICLLKYTTVYEQIFNLPDDLFHSLACYSFAFIRQIIRKDIYKYLLSFFLLVPIGRHLNRFWKLNSQSWWTH